MGFSQSHFVPERDIPALDDKVILITGGSSGLGKESIIQLAKHNPREIWLGARNSKKAAETIEEIKREVPGSGSKIKFLEIDVASLGSVSSAAQTFREKSSRLDILILNAGIMNVPDGVTKDGYEIQIGTNHLGHALLTKLLLPTLLKTAEAPGSDVRVVSISSAAHMYAPKDKGIRFDTLKGTGAAISSTERYGQSKLANLLFAKELARQYPQLTTASLHPGIVSTHLGDTMGKSSIFLKIGWAITVALMGVDVHTGTLNQLWAATSKNVKSGEYYVPVGKTGGGKKFSDDQALAKQLWDWTEKELDSYA